jgi:CubicO group peptidase (beta-lactamase class C family)
VRNADTKEPITAGTIFEAASLSKIVVAHAALQQVSAGALDLDEPLSRFAGPILHSDVGSSAITTRHVLSHTTGLPNWRRDEFPLKIYFQPGSRFSYSGEGFVYLQSALEKLARDSLNEIMKKLVFQPFGMHHSSFLWQERFSNNFASPHNDDGQPATKFRPIAANAAYSLHTTAADFARFIAAALRGDRLAPEIAQLWITPQIHAPKGRYEALESTPPETDDSVAWGLGWGLEPRRGNVFQWGSNVGATAFAIGSPEKGSALCAFANSNTGLDIMPSIVETLLPGDHPSFAWLGLVSTS